MTSNKPYLVKAIYQWCSDNDLTPHILVDTSQDGVLVPSEFIEDNRIVLNISDEATKELTLDEEAVEFMANFSHRYTRGVTRVFVPIDAVLAIYAYENGEGITFGDDDDGSACFTELDIEVGEESNTSMGKKSSKPNLTIIK